MKRLFLSLAFVGFNLSAFSQAVLTGADQLEVLLPKLSGKRVALYVNNTSMVKKTHLVDTLRSLGIPIVKVFSPEHGFRGLADAGEKVFDTVGYTTDLKVISLYAQTRKPSAEHLSDVDLVVFDMQDVGARFFTYPGSMFYMMEVCAQNGKKMIILDRPNPNGRYIDGPILNMELTSFVGMFPIPIVHGLTLGELARMINGEGWLPGKIKCDLEVIQLKNWKHADRYSIPIKPSPNLPNDHAIGMYPSTCFFEGTALSIGRGTLNPFEVTGHPSLMGQPYAFKPDSIFGMDKNPKLKGQTCYGLDMRNDKLLDKVELKYVIQMYQAFPDKEKFFLKYFDTLAGTKELKEQIKRGMSDKEIHKTWKKGLDGYRKMRGQYLLYK